MASQYEAQADGITYRAAQDEAPVTVDDKAGTVTGWNNIATDGNTTYIKYYNALAGAVTVGTTVPIFTDIIPASGASSAMGDLKELFSYSTALSVAVVQEAADNGTTAPVTDPIVQIFTN